MLDVTHLNENSISICPKFTQPVQLSCIQLAKLTNEVLTSLILVRLVYKDEMPISFFFLGWMPLKPEAQCRKLDFSLQIIV